MFFDLFAYFFTKDAKFIIFTGTESNGFMEKAIHILISYTMLVLTLLLFHKGRKHPRSLMLAFYASVEVITNGMNSLNLMSGWAFFDQYPFTHFVYKPLYCLWTPLFYFYVRYCFAADFKLKRKHVFHFTPFVLFLVFFLSILIFKGNQYVLGNLYKPGSFLFYSTMSIDITVKIQYLVYNFVMVRLLLKTEKSIKGEKTVIIPLAVDLRWLRFIVYGYALGCFGGIITTVSLFLKSPSSPIINIIGISYFFLFFFAIFYNTITNKLYSDEEKPKKIILPGSELSLLMDKIDLLLVNERLYLSPDFSLQQIADALDEKERNISHVINTVKKRNVNDYINSFRIEYACQLLLEHKEKPVFEIMYESGFNTKGAFNLAFKKQTGKTPTQFRNTTFF